MKLLIFSVLSIFYFVGLAELFDNHENCEFWASEGECEANPNYMLENCQKSCFGKSPVSKLESIYDIDNELDINGQVINFNQFRGKVLYIVNVASKCGYTAENYEMFKKLQKYRSQGLEIILAPCNQFGSQEPGDSGTISNFIRDQEFEGTVLSKADVNGDNTRPLFSYLKKATGKTRISWNFDGKFLVDRTGHIKVVDNSNIEKEIQDSLEQNEL